MDDILKEVVEERCRQDEKWGQQDHSPIEWCAILGEEVGEVNKAALEKHFGYEEAEGFLAYRKELIQVMAVAMNMIQSLERNEIAGGA
jgi:NTP pyrophosphatase (non-canonical NTP hydrolase)